MTIPVRVRQKMGVEVGDELLVKEEGKRIVFEKAPTVERLAGAWTNIEDTEDFMREVVGSGSPRGHNFSPRGMPTVAQPVRLDPYLPDLSPALPSEAKYCWGPKTGSLLSQVTPARSIPTAKALVFSTEPPTGSTFSPKPSRVVTPRRGSGTSMMATGSVASLSKIFT